MLWFLVGSGNSLIISNLDCDGKLLGANKSFLAYSTQSLKKSHLLSQKLTWPFLKVIHAYSRSSTVIWILPVHRRIPSMINLLPIFNFVSLSMIVLLYIRVMISPLILSIVSSCYRYLFLFTLEFPHNVGEKWWHVCWSNMHDFKCPFCIISSKEGEFSI